MGYHFSLHYGWFFQNLGKEAVRTFMHTTVVGFRDLVGTGIAPVSKKTAVKEPLKCLYGVISKTRLDHWKLFLDAKSKSVEFGFLEIGAEPKN